MPCPNVGLVRLSNLISYHALGCKNTYPRKEIMWTNEPLDIILAYERHLQHIIMVLQTWIEVSYLQGLKWELALEFMFDNSQISIYWNVELDMQTVVFLYESTDIRDGISHILALQIQCVSPRRKK